MPTEPSTSRDRVLGFGPFELSEQEGELRKSGVRIKLQEQPFRVLVELVANSGKVVSREDLHRKLWPADTFVDFDVGLNSAIRKLRQALNDDADHHLRPRAKIHHPALRFRCLATVRALRHAKKFSASLGDGIGFWRRRACLQWWPTGRW